MIFKIQLLGLCFCMNFLYSQFNTVYHQRQVNSNYQINPEKKTGNIFLDFPDIRKSDNQLIKNRKLRENKKEYRLLEKVITKDSQKVEKLKDTVLTAPKDLAKLPNEVNGNDPSDFEEVDQEIIYKKYPLIYDDRPKKRTVIMEKIHMPLNNIRVTSKYGYRIHPVYGTKKLHSGVDLRANYDRVFSVLNGNVSRTGYSPKNGKYVVIDHRHFKTFYLHLSSILVSEGQAVMPGTVVAISGNTGTSTAPHLHFAVKEDDRFINPVEFLNNLIIANNTISESYGKRNYNQ